MAWVWSPVGPHFQACPTSGHDRNQTLGLRSVVPLASSSLLSPDRSRSLPDRSHPIMPRCEAGLLLPIENTVFQCRRQLCEPHSTTARPTTAKLEYQPPLVPTTQELWRSCGTPLQWASRKRPAPETEHAPQAPPRPEIFRKVAVSGRNIVSAAAATP